MKALLLFFMIAAMPVVAVGQSVNHSLQQSGILFPDDGFIKTDGRLSNNVSSNLNYDFSKLSLPGKDHDTVFRKLNSTLYIEKNTPSLKSTAQKDPDNRFFQFLEEVKTETKIENPKERFRITGSHVDNLGITHVRAVQQYKGLEVYGSESTFHIDAKKERLFGKTINLNEPLDIQPSITMNEALVLVKNDLSERTHLKKITDSQKKMIGYSEPKGTLIIYPLHNEARLVWEIDYRANLMEEWKYFIDAQTGETIRAYNNTKSDGPATATGIDLNDMNRTFNVYLTEGIYYMYDITQRMYNASTNEGIIITLDANSTSTSFLDYTYVTSTDNIWTQHAAISAHCNATKTYTYFDTTFNWNSINGKGCNIISLVNIVEEDGSSMENAFWNGQAVFYGNGGNYLKPLAGALDVTAHELSHGVVATTANLEYYGQSGAINESFADIFACMVDRFDWTIGEDITKEGYSPSGFIRDLSAPHNMGDSSMSYWQPAHMSEIYRGTDDNAGIHINSGICNHAFYLFAVQTGKEKAEQVYFRALSEYLTKTSDFIDLRLAVVQSAKDLYGDGSDEAYYAAAAFEAVGIYEESAIDKTQDYQPNPGTEMLLTYDTNPNDPVAVYVSTSGGTGYRPLTNTPMRGKISVTDDGSKGVFVSGDRRLRMINVNSPEINETIISGYAFYDNVAISKDGKRLAATKGWADGSIYLVDLVTGEGRQFILYNPTTSPSNIDAGGVLKAYSIEFDITGEYLIYDAYNVINSNSLKDIYYWDIGFVKVWDNKTNGFGNGKVSKLFTTLPANVNVANPVFSKNSPYIIAFDYFYDDGIIEEYAVYGANLETGAVNSISSNDRLGYPSYSTNDDRIAYNTINGLNMQVVKSIKLKPDKISPAADPGVLVPDAKWPVFFTSGTRPLGLPPVAHFTSDYKYGNFPLSVTFMDLSSNNPSSWSWSFDGGEPDCSAEQYPEVTFKEPGFYDVTLITENAFGSDTIKRETYIHVINPVGTSEIENIEFQVFPNPVMDKLTISGEKYEFIKIFDMQGDLILYDTYKSQLDLSHFRPGIYILELENGNTFYRQKLIKQ